MNARPASCPDPLRRMKRATPNPGPNQSPGPNSKDMVVCQTPASPAHALPQGVFSWISVFVLLKNVDLQPPPVTLQRPLNTVQPPSVAFHVPFNYVPEY